MSFTNELQWLGKIEWESLHDEYLLLENLKHYFQVYINYHYKINITFQTITKVSGSSALVNFYMTHMYAVYIISWLLLLCGLEADKTEQRNVLKNSDVLLFVFD